MKPVEKMQYLSNHYKPSRNDILHSHIVTKGGKTWSAHFQKRWLESFHWLSHSSVLEGGICRYCILFPEQLSCRGGGLSGKLSVLVLSPYQKPYPKALGKDGILTLHEKSGMHCHATEKGDFFVRGFQDPSERVDNRFLKQQTEQEKVKKLFVLLFLQLSS